MCKCASIVVSSSLCNWCYDTLTKRKRERKIVAIRNSWHSILWGSMIVMVYVYVPSLVDVYMNVEKCECSMFSVSFFPHRNATFIIAMQTYCCYVLISVSSGDFHLM